MPAILLILPRNKCRDNAPEIFIGFHRQLAAKSKKERCPLAPFLFIIHDTGKFAEYAFYCSKSLLILYRLYFSSASFSCSSPSPGSIKYTLSIRFLSMLCTRSTIPSFVVTDSCSSGRRSNKSIIKPPKES